jgi:hypothetical protein
MRHPRQGDVVRVAAPPGDKTQILMTPHRLTDAELHAVSSIPALLDMVSCVGQNSHGQTRNLLTVLH